MKKDAFWKRNKCKLAIGGVVVAAGAMLFFIIWLLYMFILSYFFIFNIRNRKKIGRYIKNNIYENIWIYEYFLNIIYNKI